ncbi:MAG TPA: glycosyl hydrolase family 28-related protein [Planctomycetaceae bacterium]|nr:glycosyl hydrolase family 28-related protein [Planctomycetaceae bacterium]
MRRLLVMFGLIGWCSQSTAHEIVRWSFEKDDRAHLNAGAIIAATRAAADTDYDVDVPGPFVYDPLSRTSRSNTASRRFVGSERSSRPVAAAIESRTLGLDGKNLTLEAFVKPDADARGDAWIAGFTRQSDQAAEMALQWFQLHNSNQTWHGYEVVPPGGKPHRSPVGHYSSSTRLDDRVAAWRHLALVYDADHKTVRCWVDYHLMREVKVAQPLIWDGGLFLIGGRPDHWGVKGLIDEVRLTTAALTPADFQRARKDAITGVGFHSNQQIAPLDAGCLDVKAHFGAAGDGKTDDTDAFNTAFAHLASRVPLAYNTLLIPPGEYLISDLLHCSRFIDVKGAGPGRTVLKLRDNAPGYADPEKPRPLLRMSSTSGDPGSHGWVNGSSISIYLDGVTVDTGVGNPGAKGLEYHSNNVGRLENVVIRSGDGTGVIGLDLTHHDVGPALIKHVTVEGFDLGSAIRYQEYSMTFEHFTLRKQRVAGLKNQGNIVALRHFRSENRVPAILSEGPNSMVTLLDSQLVGGDPKEAAIRSDGALYALRVTTEGYGNAIQKRQLVSQNPVEWKDVNVPGPKLDEYISDQTVSGHGAMKGSLKLPIEETPEPPARPISEWVSLGQFTDKKAGDDCGPVVQAAIDSGARVIYCPTDLHVQFLTPVILRGKVERIVGYGGEWNWSPSVWKDEGQRQQTDREKSPPALVTFDDPDPQRTVWIDRLSIQALVHSSPGTLVLRSSSPTHYRTGAANGRLFAEDIGGADWHFDHPQTVWVRQWNPESHAAGPCIHTRGTTLWALGFKTEYESQKLLAEAGSATEILGAFIYPIGKIPEDRPIFENRNSRIALIYGTSVYQSNHRVHIRDVRGSDTKTVSNDALRWAGSRARMDLYTSDARP